MLQYEYMAGHQISVHTWEHPMLTTKTNEEIVASLGWTKEAIKQIVRQSLLASMLFLTRSSFADWRHAKHDETALRRH